MYRIKSRSSKNVIGITLSGRLTAELYQEIVPHLEKRIKEYGKIRLLIELDHWDGWDAMASMKDMAFIFKNSFKIERVAFVLDSKGDKQAVLLDQPFRPWFRNHTRYFAGKEQEEAWAWVEEGVLGAEGKGINEVGLKKKRKTRYGRKMKVLVVGGGFSGLSMGLLLQERGFKPCIVEAKANPEDQDIMLNLWPSGSGVLKSMGIYKKVKKLSRKMVHRKICDQDGKVLHDYDFDRIVNQYGEPLLAPYKEVKELVKSKIKAPYFNAGVAVTKLEKVEGGTKVYFSDGTKLKFDLVICCDGLHSKMRELVFGVIEPEYSGFVGWSFCVKPSFECKNEVLEYWAKDRFIQFYPWEDKLYGFAGFREEVEQKRAGNKDRGIKLLKESFKDFGGIVPKVMNALSGTEGMWHDNIYGLHREEWVDAGVVLLGDAASAFLPTSALSPSLALESAYVLAEELGRSDTNLLNRALESYASRRIGRINQMEELLKREGLLEFVDHEAMKSVADLSRQFKPEKALLRFWQDYLEGRI